MFEHRVGVVLVSLFCLILAGCGIADLRPDGVKSLQASEMQAVETEGRKILRKSAEAHGLEAVGAYESLMIEAEDRWPTWWVQDFLGWWPQGTQKMRMQMRLGVPESEMELLDGEWKGQTVGIRGGKGFCRGEGDAPCTENHQLMTFYRPALQYFAEMPFRIREAEVVLSAGETTLDGKRYHKVFATWKHPEPHPDFDQYVLWIDAETMLLAKAHYTVRDSGYESATGTVHFDDYRDVGGVQIAFRQRVVLPDPVELPEPGTSDIFHELELTSAVFQAPEN